MKPDVPYIEAKFQEFNSLMFDNALPAVPVELSKASSYVGLCTFKTRRHLFGKVEYYDFRLRFSTRLDLPEAEVEDTIIHEMIHYYIRLNRIKDTSAHGKVFRQMMNELNSRFGRHITISHRTTKEQREAALDKRPRQRVVAIVSFKDGREGLKLLPCKQEKVADISFWVESDPWFNRFPTSSAFNVIFAPMDEVRAHLSKTKHPASLDAGCFLSLQACIDL